MRVTENIRFNTMANNLFNAQTQYLDVMEKTASQKKVNRASDDPIAATKIIEIRQGLAANEQYKTNMNNADAWISATESKLSGAYDLLVNAQEIALGQATATANATTRTIAAQNVQALIDEMASLANAKLGDRYLFSGSLNSTEPFSTTPLGTQIGVAASAGDNTFQGTVTSSGTYTGATNKSYAVKITAGGALAAATYQFSADGGRTWNGTDLSLAGGSVTLGDGVVLTFDDLAGTSSFGQNDVFHVQAIAGGYYRGNDDAQSLSINRGAALTYNITGAEAFTATGGGSSDVFAALNALKDALNSNDIQGISDQVENLKNAQNQITLNQSLCGAKANHVEVARSNLTELEEKMTSLLSEVQDADMIELATKLSMKELALQASYAIAAKIGDTTILNFLK